MKPELVGATNPVAATQGAMDQLQKVAPDAESWFITPPSARNPATSIFWQPKKKEGEKRERRSDTRATLDGNGQVIHARDPPGGFFLYRFHFDLHYIPVLWARYLVGPAALLIQIGSESCRERVCQYV